MLNFVFKSLNTHNNKIKNKNVLKKSNQLIYNIIYSVYKVISLFIYPFQRRFITLYTSELQLNRLPFRVLPNSIKYILIYLVDINSWILFFKRIKNNNNLYIIREKNNTKLYRLWCYFFLTELFYYPELNSKRSKSNEISNVFYSIRILNKYTKKVSRLQYKSIIFYYINKLAFSNYPYLYWTYIFAYNRYNYNPDASERSQNVRSQIFFFFINEYNKFINNSKPESFIKLDFYTFKGIKKTLRKLEKIKKQKHIFKKKIVKDKILTKIEEQLMLIDKNFIKIYYNFMGGSSIATHKVYLNSIIYNNYIKFNILTDAVLLNILNLFKIKWYNKIHNSISNTVKKNLILFLRNTKHFNKGRYSRNRQLYRTGVYWCIWLNIVIVYSLHFYFYRVVYSFGYLWMPLGLMILSIFSSRFYKYRYYNNTQLMIEFTEFNNFLKYLFSKIQYIYIAHVKLNKINFFKNYYKLIYFIIKLRILNTILFIKKWIF